MKVSRRSVAATLLAAAAVGSSAVAPAGPHGGPVGRTISGPGVWTRGFEPSSITGGAKSESPSSITGGAKSESPSSITGGAE